MSRQDRSLEDLHLEVKGLDEMMLALEREIAFRRNVGDPDKDAITVAVEEYRHLEDVLSSLLDLRETLEAHKI